MGLVLIRIRSVFDIAYRSEVTMEKKPLREILPAQGIWTVEDLARYLGMKVSCIAINSNVSFPIDTLHCDYLLNLIKSL